MYKGMFVSEILDLALLSSSIVRKILVSVFLTEKK